MTPRHQSETPPSSSVNLQQIENRMSTAEGSFLPACASRRLPTTPDLVSEHLCSYAPRSPACSRRSKTYPTVTPPVYGGGKCRPAGHPIPRHRHLPGHRSRRHHVDRRSAPGGAVQVQGILQQLVSLSQTSVNGQLHLQRRPERPTAATPFAPTAIPCSTSTGRAPPGQIEAPQRRENLHRG